MTGDAGHNRGKAVYGQVDGWRYAGERPCCSTELREVCVALWVSPSRIGKLVVGHGAEGRGVVQNAHNWRYQACGGRGAWVQLGASCSRMKISPV